LFTEELRLIKDAEEKADQMRNEARLTAKARIQETDLKANQLVENAFAVEKEQCKLLIEQGQRIATQQYDEAMAQARVLCEELSVSAGKKQNKAISFIAERIVNSSVNR
jgi:vacuolar-type H+-ATPase subunit H